MKDNEEWICTCSSATGTLPKATWNSPATLKKKEKERKEEGEKERKKEKKRKKEEKEKSQ